MDVSHFELVYKPQSPVPPADTVLQGYFLKISNLEDVELSFRVTFVTSSITDPDRSLFQNTVAFVDTPGSNNNSGVFSLVGGLSDKSFRLNRLIVIPAHGTALVALLPSDPFAMPGAPLPVPDFECRGYVQLTLPAIIRRGNKFLFTSQSEDPVHVMLTPQHRATYLSPAGVINDQTQSSLPVAGGSAIALVDPEPPRLTLFPVQPPIFTFDPDRFKTLVDQFELDPSILAGLLAQAANGAMDLTAFNKALAAEGIPMAIENRKL
jgi:hypothetical protein